MTRPDQSPSIMARPSSSRPNSAKSSCGIEAIPTTMPTRCPSVEAPRRAILPIARIAGVSKARGISLWVAPVRGNVPWRCRDGQAERVSDGPRRRTRGCRRRAVPRRIRHRELPDAGPRRRGPSHSFLVCPPERTGSTIVQGDVDSVIADAVVARVRQRRVGMLAVYGGCDVMVEGERIPGEAAVTRQKRRRDPLKAAATIGPGGQMQQRPPGQ